MKELSRYLQEGVAQELLKLESRKSLIKTFRYKINTESRENVVRINKMIT